MPIETAGPVSYAPEAPTVPAPALAPPSEAAAPAPDASPLAAMEQLRALLETLVPPETVTVHDAFGGTHRIRGVLVARAQVLVMRHLEALAGAEVPDSLRQVALGGGLSSIAAVVMQLAADPHVLQGLSDAFGVAHPGAVRAAIEAAHVAGEAPASHEPMDLFPVEELVAGLAPFLLRLARRLLETVSLVMAASQPMTPDL